MEGYRGSSSSNSSDIGQPDVSSSSGWPSCSGIGEEDSVGGGTMPSSTSDASSPASSGKKSPTPTAQ
ncbi:hypothetical protein X975_04096, partial [Stegodyphus mimosarum]